jgi:phosphotriesterase-related protein
MHVRQVQTVIGPIGIDQLGVVLAHEHVFVDTRAFCSPAGHRLQDPIDSGWAALAELRRDPFGHSDNALLGDEETAVAELVLARQAGARTIIDPTPVGLGRRPEALARVSRRTGLNIVMGSGWYVEQTHPSEVGRCSAGELAKSVVQQLTHGADGTAIRAGIIGEIGLSDEPTLEELKVLEAAGLAQIATAVPLYVHLPAWGRVGNTALGLLARVGVASSAVVLCHLNPSIGDPGYQAELAAARAWLGFDMAGHDQFAYSDGRRHPSDEDVAGAIARLVRSGFGGQLLISSDVYLKIQLARFGGRGYGHALLGFGDRLREQGLSSSEVHSLFVDNPRRLFSELR